MELGVLILDPELLELVSKPEEAVKFVRKKRVKSYKPQGFVCCAGKFPFVKDLYPDFGKEPAVMDLRGGCVVTREGAWPKDLEPYLIEHNAWELVGFYRGIGGVTVYMNENGIGYLRQIKPDIHIEARRQEFRLAFSYGDLDALHEYYKKYVPALLNGIEVADEAMKRTIEEAIGSELRRNEELYEAVKKRRPRKTG
jgi:hypothetical protein